MVTIENLTGQVIVKPKGSINGKQLQITNLKNCTLVVLDFADSVFVDDCVGSEIILAFVEGSLFVRDSKNVDVHAVCGQLRTRGCSQLQLYLYLTTEPIVETSSEVHFASFCSGLPFHAEILNGRKSLTAPNLYAKVHDFSKSDESIKAPHFATLKDEEKTKLCITYKDDNGVIHSFDAIEQFESSSYGKKRILHLDSNGVRAKDEPPAKKKFVPVEGVPTEGVIDTVKVFALRKGARANPINSEIKNVYIPESLITEDLRTAIEGKVHVFANVAYRVDDLGYVADSITLISPPVEPFEATLTVAGRIRRKGFVIFKNDANEEFKVTKDLAGEAGLGDTIHIKGGKVLGYLLATSVDVTVKSPKPQPAVQAQAAQPLALGEKGTFDSAVVRKITKTGVLCASGRSTLFIPLATLAEVQVKEGDHIAGEFVVGEKGRDITSFTILDTKPEPRSDNNAAAGEQKDGGKKRRRRRNRRKKSGPPSVDIVESAILSVDNGKGSGKRRELPSRVRDALAKSTVNPGELGIGPAPGEITVRFYIKSKFEKMREFLIKSDMFIEKLDNEESLGRQIAHDSKSVIIAECDGQIIGTVYMLYNPWQTFIYHLCVHPDHRKKGVANLLMDKVEQLCKVRKVKCPTIFVEQGNEGVVKFYNNRGWFTTESPAVLLGKDL